GAGTSAPPAADGIQERFSARLPAAPDAMVVVDREGRIELVNTQLEQLFGYTREELVGQPIELLVPQRFREHHPRDRARYLEDPRSRPMGAGLLLYGVRKDGSEFPAEISLAPMQTGERLSITAAVRDVSERRRDRKSTRLNSSHVKISYA